MDGDHPVSCCLCMKELASKSSLQKHLAEVHALPGRSWSSDLSQRHDDGATIATTSSGAGYKPILSTGGSPHPASTSSKCEHSVATSDGRTVTESEDAPPPLCLPEEYSHLESEDDFPDKSNTRMDMFSVNEEITPVVSDSNLMCSENGISSSCDEMVTSCDEVNDISVNTVQAGQRESNERCGNKKSTKVITTPGINEEHVNNNDTVLPTTDILESSKDKSSSNNHETDKEELGENSNSKSVLQKEKNILIDFHFLLGTTTIKGNSMTYDRVEFQCMHCSFSSAWRPSLVKHMKAAHSDVLAFHEVLDIQNTQPGPHQQSELSKKYRIMKMSDHTNLVRAHKMKKRERTVEFQDIPGKFTCPICDKVFNRMRYIRRHQTTHRAQRDYLCDHCGKSFKTKATLMAHSRSHSDKVYRCPQCDFVSSLRGAIHRHRQLHPNGSVMCDVCGAAYNDKSTLKKHGRVHDLSRPFPCPHPTCTWRFKSENLMKAHAAAHSAQGKFQCPTCFYRFRHKHHLQRHIAKIHPQTVLPDNCHLVSSSSSAMPGEAKSLPESNSSDPSALTGFPEKLEVDGKLEDPVHNGFLEAKVISPSQDQTLALSVQTDLEEGMTPAENIMEVVVNDGHDIIINIHSDSGLSFPGSDGTLWI